MSIRLLMVCQSENQATRLKNENHQQDEFNSLL